MDLFSFYPVAAVIGLAAAVFCLAWYMEWRRRKGLGELAASMGLPFNEEGPELYALEASGLEIFGIGRAHKASNLIQLSSAAGGMRFFDYRYTSGSGKSRKVHKFTLALVECSRCQVPVFELKPESLIYKVGEILGFKDIDLPAFPLFSDKYRLTGEDEAAVRMFFTPSRAAWFERHPGLRVQGCKNYLVLFRGEGLLPAPDWRNFMEEVGAFASETLK